MNGMAYRNDKGKGKSNQLQNHNSEIICCVRTDWNIMNPKPTDLKPINQNPMKSKQIIYEISTFLSFCHKLLGPNCTIYETSNFEKSYVKITDIRIISKKLNCLCIHTYNGHSNHLSSNPWILNRLFQDLKAWESFKLEILWYLYRISDLTWKWVRFKFVIYERCNAWWYSARMRRCYISILS